MKTQTTLAIVIAAVFAVVAAGLTLLARSNRDAARPLGAATRHQPSDQARIPVAIDSRRQQLIGVRVVTVQQGTQTPRVRAAGVVTYDETRLADINLKVEGWIRDLYVNYTGQTVSRDQALFSVYSPDLVSAQTQLVAAIKSRDQLAATSGDEHDYAARFLDTPRQRLQRWDVPEDQVRAIERAREILPTIVFRSPSGGVVIEKTALKGMHVEPGQRLYKIADMSVVWVEADFYEPDVSRLRLGAAARVALDALPGELLPGRIAYISPYMSEATRTVKARVELVNRQHRLKPGMSASVEVSAADVHGLLVPVDAIIDSGQGQIVFVADGDGHFEPRPVIVGGQVDGHALVVSGLREHESVAARAAFLIDSESQMRAALESYEPDPRSGSAVSDAAVANLQLRVTPARAGDNVVEVSAQTPDGHPIADADIEVQFYMPAMPAMNMPAMSSSAKVVRVGDGLYRGAAALAMSGRWNVSVAASRDKRPLASMRTTLAVR